MSQPGLPEQVLVNALAQALVELIARALEGGKAVLAKRDPLAECLGGDSTVRRAVRDAVNALVEVERVDPEIGGDALKEFLASPEVEQLLRQVYASSWGDSVAEYRGNLEDEFVNALVRAVPVPRRDARDVASRIFEALVRAAERALDAAIEGGVLAAHEARATSRHHVLRDELTSLRQAVEALGNARPDRRIAALRLERDLKQQVAVRHGHISPFDFDRERRVPLNDLYVAPDLSRRNAERNGAPLTLPAFLATAHREVVLGHPGVGKSTLFQKIALDMAVEYDSRLVAGRELTPFPIVLRDYAAAREQHGASVVRFMAQVGEREYRHRPCSTDDIEYLLFSGRLLVLFDGLDELIETSHRREVRDDIETFCSSYPAVPVLVTSRKVGYDQAPLDPRQFRISEIASFSTDQVGDYVTRWFATNAASRSDGERTTIVRSLLDESTEIADLRETPLMLALICSLYSARTSLPKNRPAVYQACAELMFRKWDEHRRIKLDAPFEYHLRPCLDHLAWWVFGDSSREAGVSEDALVDAAAEYLEAEQYEDRDSAQEAARTFIEFCRGRPWVLTDTGTTAEGERLYEFTHRTFLEFYAAEYVARHAESPEDLVAVIGPKVRAAEWDVVAQLAIQLADRARHGAATRVIEALIGDLPPLASERLNIESFVIRLLELVVVPPRVVRQVIKAVVADILTWSQLSLAERRGTATPSRILEELLRLREHPDILPMVVEAITSGVTDALGDSSYDRALAAVQLGTALPDMAHRARRAHDADHRSQSDEWRAVAATVLAESENRLEQMANVRFGAALLAVRSGAIPVTAFVRRYRIRGLFRRDPIAVMPGTDATSLAKTLLLPGHAVPEIAVVDSYAPLEELARILSVAEQPWIFGQHEDRLDSTALAAVVAFPTNQRHARLGGLLLLTPEAERNLGLEEGVAAALRRELEHGDVPRSIASFASGWLNGSVRVRGSSKDEEGPFGDVG